MDRGGIRLTWRQVALLAVIVGLIAAGFWYGGREDEGATGAAGVDPASAGAPDGASPSDSGAASEASARPDVPGNVPPEEREPAPDAPGFAEMTYGALAAFYDQDFEWLAEHGSAGWEADLREAAEANARGSYSAGNNPIGDFADVNASFADLIRAEYEYDVQGLSDGEAVDPGLTPTAIDWENAEVGAGDLQWAEFYYAVSDEGDARWDEAYIIMGLYGSGGVYRYKIQGFAVRYPESGLVNMGPAGQAP